ncbi:MAG: nucleotidyltransferase domain-containing protein [Candidatus Bathyarchaeia archaeon]
MEKRREEYSKLLEESLAIIVDKLKGKVEKISIFGSYAKGRRDLFTDLDVVIVMRTDKPFIERMKEIYSLLALPVDADILCYTPEEYEEMKAGFLRDAEEIILYEKGGETGRPEMA